MMYVMEEQLIKKLRKGDEKAFRLLYDRHYVLLCRFANQISELSQVNIHSSSD